MKVASFIITNPKIKENKVKVKKEKKLKIQGKDCRILTDKEKESLKKDILEAEKEFKEAKKALKNSRKLDKDHRNKVKNEFKNKKDALKTAKDKEKKLLKQERKRLAYERTEINKFYNKWVQVMAYMGLYNEMSQTYALRNIKYTPFGFSANIHAPLGMSLLALESDNNIAIIQKNLQCVFITNDVPKSNHIEAKFILQDSGFVDFKPIKLKPYEILLSQNIDGSPMISNMLKYPHALVQGSTNMGKSKFIDIILTNIIVTNNPKDVSLYILQADKSDQYVYSGCKHCKGYTDNILESLVMLDNLVKIVEKRNTELKQYNYNGIANNINEYNEAVSKKIINGSKWDYMYLIIDEYASLMPESSFGADKKIKQAIQAIMERIIQIGRSVGLYCILSTQRATIDKLPSFLKANCCTIVTFKVNNRKSSEVALDSGEAVNLKQREFITKIERMNFGQTYNLTQKQIVDYIKPFRNPQPSDFKFEMSDSVKELLDEAEGRGKHKRKTKAERKQAKKEAERLLEISKAEEKEELRKLNEEIEKSFAEKENIEEKTDSVTDVKYKVKKEKVKLK
jgi:S-DNA-T family DNA segregation ATPase FtsK/SpoIIIE